MARLKFKDGNGNWQDTLTQVNVIQGSGVTSYEDLTNKPSINSVTLSGNKTSSDLGLQSAINNDNKLSADLIESGIDNKVFTAANQVKLSNIEAGAQVNTVNSVNSKTGAVVLNASDVGAINPNLLINGDFRVNQRGENSYTFSPSGTKIYTVDRWRLSGQSTASTVTVTPISKGITITMNTAGTTTTYLINPIEELDKLRGKTLTLSLSTPNGIKSLTFTVPSSGTGGASAVAITTGLNLRLYTQPNFLEITIDILPTFTGSYDIYWAKLELGEVATPFSPRPYAEELEMCKRYYVKYKSSSTFCGISNGYVYSSTHYRFVLPLSMRTAPTISYSGIYIQTYDTATSGLILSSIGSVGSIQNGSNSIFFQCTISSSSVVNQIGSCAFLTTGANSDYYLELDAEIY